MSCSAYYYRVMSKQVLLLFSFLFPPYVYYRCIQDVYVHTRMSPHVHVCLVNIITGVAFSTQYCVEPIFSCF